ncbi:hypothetical protein ACIQM4_13945 [Streptomyces sp. NPDC091272]|uniref:hypothetical protein n=1 Tax=Streptomyces sp. NPDC091272 TaxID=3365981 RepID=UPI0038255BC4
MKQNSRTRRGATAMTALDRPVHLELPMRAPTPAPDCDVCAALVRQRQQARSVHDYSAVTDADVELRNHPHGGVIRMGKHGDGKAGSDGDKQQSPKESDGQWSKPVQNPPKK